MISAVVTGHSRGIGAGVARHLLERDIRVLGISRHGNADLVRRAGAKLTEAALDLADAAAVARWLAGDALSHFLRGPGTALLVNNAGMLQPIGPLEAQDVEQVARAVTVNVGATFMLSAAFARVTRELSERRILHISSGAATSPYAGWSVYGGTKAALDQHARGVALDKSPGLRIASVAPGVIDTEMQTEIRGTPEDKFPQRQRFVALKREGRLHDADETGALLVEFLLSDAFGSEAVVDLRAKYATR